jgi:hypothetical protein
MPRGHDPGLVHLREHEVHRHFQQHRSWRHAERLAHGQRCEVWDPPGCGHPLGPAGDGPRNGDLVDAALQFVEFGLSQWRRTRDHQHRRAVSVRAHEAGHTVGESGPSRDRGDAEGAGRLGVAFGRVPDRAFVATVDQLYANLLAGQQEGVEVPAVQGEYHLHVSSLERAG